MLVILVPVTFLVILVVGYVINVLFTSSGSELKGNSFDDFIAYHKAVNPDTNVNQRKYHYYERFSEQPGCQLRIVFGTEYGASEDIAKTLYRRILSAECETSVQFQPRLINCRDYQHVEWKEEQLSLFIISTSGDGVPPTDAMEFMKYIQRTSVPLPQLHYSVLALGDSNYPHFCKTGKQLDASLQRLGAKSIADRLNVDMEDASTISQWMESVFTALSTLHINKTQDYLPCSLNVGQTESYNRTNPFYATISHKRMLTVSTSIDDRETIHIEFDLTGSCLVWQSGDALGIYPQNNPVEVKDLLVKAQLPGDELVRVDNERCTAEPISLAEALTQYCNLKDVSLTLLSHFRDALNNPQLIFKGEVRDLFSLYPTVHVNPQLLVQLLRPLLPRYYSISSSPLVNADKACVTAAAVRYNMMDIERTGVCSVHLVERCLIGDKLGVFISHNPDFRLPSNGEASLLMIGPGTGLAPFMSFIAERVHLKAAGEMTLYFGCRNKEKDFLYREQLTKWKDEGVIKLHTAFSREHSEKVYVQHLMSKHSKVIFEHMQNNGYTYICGDATHMARDVHRTLLDICMVEGSMTASEAADYLSELTANCRYQKDVWVT